MIHKTMKCIIGRYYLILAIWFGTTGITSAQEQFTQDSLSYTNVNVQKSEVSQQQDNQKKNGIPIGLLAYNKWVDLNENEVAEKNEFFGLGKESFSKGEAISASLYDPTIVNGTKLKLRIWDTSGNLIRTVRKNYKSDPLFTYSNFDAFLPVGKYILTVNPEGVGTTYQIKFDLKEPNGKAFLKIRKKLLPENFYLFKEWIDEDGDMKMDSVEVLGLNQNQYDLGNVDLQVGLNLPMSDAEVVYQIWNSKYDLIAMNISRMDSLQHYTMRKDTVNEGNHFLRILKTVPAGEYLLTASLSNSNPVQYRLLVQINDTIKSITKDEVVDPELVEQIDKVEELEPVDSIPEAPKMEMNVKENVENLAPEFTKGQQGFFIFTAFMDLNENNKQEVREFIGANQEYYYSESENVFAQFHFKEFVNRELDLKIFDSKDQLVRQQIGSYRESPFVFKISIPDEPLIPGDYTLIIKIEGSEIKYRFELKIK